MKTVLALAVCLPIAGNAQSARETTYNLATQFSDDLQAGERYYQIASIAPRCGLRTYPWMFGIQGKILAGQDKLMSYYSGIATDRKLFRGVALDLRGDEAGRILEWDTELSRQGPTTTDCLALRRSGILDHLDGLMK